METFKVKFLTDNIEVTAQRGDTILSCAVRAGIYINASCAGDGVCGRCAVIIKKGNFKAPPSANLSLRMKEEGYLLACQTVVEDNIEVLVPEGSRLDMEGAIASEDSMLRSKGIDAATEEAEPGTPLIDEKIFCDGPLTAKIFLRIPPPGLEDRISDLERVYRQISLDGKIDVSAIGLSRIRGLGKLLRESDWQVTATIGTMNGVKEIILIEPGDTSKKNYGFAFDIGTTTVSGQLIDLNTRKILGTRAGYNRQAIFGADVISRIVFACEGDGLERLHQAVSDNINEIIRELVSEHGISMNEITGVMAAGNTTMIHLLLRIDPSYMRREPYVPTANFIPVIRASEAGIKINPRGLLACIPGVSSYVGGDITSGVISCGISDSEELSLLIDIGTNGEIALGNREWLACCAASAGPAFEGSGMGCGMRAAKGAIQKVAIKSKNGLLDVFFDTIGGGPPRGVCGSGYIDVLSEMMRAGIMDKNGRISRAWKSDRIRECPDGFELVLAFKNDTGTDKDITITDADIENLKRSKGAIYSAVTVLVKKIGVSFADIKKIYIAGGFGTGIDARKAVHIGLLPDVPRDRFVFAGNSSLIGSRELLLSYDIMRKAEETARKMTYIELCAEPAYMDEYVASLFFPHTDMTRFPTGDPG